jgi:hypothetical protein
MEMNPCKGKEWKWRGERSWAEMLCGDGEQIYSNHTISFQKYGGSQVGKMTIPLQWKPTSLSSPCNRKTPVVGHIHDVCACLGKRTRLWHLLSCADTLTTAPKE